MVNHRAPSPLVFPRRDLSQKQADCGRLDIDTSLSLTPQQCRRGSKAGRKTPQKHNQTTRLTIMRTAEPWSFVSAAAGQGGNELPWWLWVCCLLDWCLMRACLMLSVTERRLRTVCGERKGMTQRASNRDGQKRRLERWRYVNEEREWEK